MSSSDDITSEVNFVGKLNISQEFFCLKWVLKWVSKFGDAFVSFGVEAKRDATSAISFWTPGVWTTNSGDELHICCLSASARSRCPALSDRAENFRAHATVAELSHLIPI